MKKAIPYIIGIGELQRKAADIIKSVESEQEGFIVSHNQPQAVLMSLKRYQQLKSLEEAKKLEEGEVLAIVRAGDLEFEKGQTKRLKNLKELL